MTTQNFAEHLLALLESSARGEPHVHKDLASELVRTSKALTGLQVRMGKNAEGLSKKPAHHWNEEEITFAICESRVDLLTELLDGFDEEKTLIETLPLEAQPAEGGRLLRFLTRCLECEENLPCDYEMSELNRARLGAPGVVGPKKVPPWVQALQQLEMRLLEESCREDKLPGVTALLRLQHDVVQKLKIALICELFPAQEGIYCSSDEFELFVDGEWNIWVLTRTTSANDES